jgi:hypothetical protein
MPQPLGVFFPTDSNVPDYGIVLYSQLPLLRSGTRTVRPARSWRTSQGGRGRTKHAAELCGHYLSDPG